MALKLPIIVFGFLASASAQLRLFPLREQRQAALRPLSLLPREDTPGPHVALLALDAASPSVPAPHSEHMETGGHMKAEMMNALKELRSSGGITAGHTESESPVVTNNSSDAASNSTAVTL